MRVPDMTTSIRNLALTSFLRTFFAVVLIGSLATAAHAQTTTPAEVPPSASSSIWRTTVGDQHAKLLRSGDDAVRIAALQNLIVLANLRPGAFDLTPAVPELLSMYDNEANSRQLRIMTVSALRAVGDERGMDALYRLSSREHRGSKVYQVAQNALKHYYTEQAMEREMERSAYFMAKGDLERADRHALRATIYRNRLG